MWFGNLHDVADIDSLDLESQCNISTRHVWWEILHHVFGSYVCGAGLYVNNSAFCALSYEVVATCLMVLVVMTLMPIIMYSK